MTVVEALDEGIFAQGEPLVMHDATIMRTAAAPRWSSPAALSEAYGHLRFQLAGGLEITLAEYLDYAATSPADFPYYLVETSFKGVNAALLEDYLPPPVFADDLPDVPGTSSKPHWFLGGARTGSKMHVDPRSTCGWNVCLFGCKRWCMLPPDTDLAALGLEPYSTRTAPPAGRPTICRHCRRPRPPGRYACASAFSARGIWCSSPWAGGTASSTWSSPARWRTR